MSEIRAIPNEDLKRLGNQGFALAFRILGHREDAADAVQDSLCQLFRKHASFDSKRGSIKAWFLKIVRNRCIDIQRKSRPQTGAAEYQPVDSVAGPLQRVQQSELISHVKMALEQMPQAGREIIMLRDFHGLSYAEISEVLGIAGGTVMSRLHRARQQLRDKVLTR